MVTLVLALTDQFGEELPTAVSEALQLAPSEERSGAAVSGISSYQLSALATADGYPRGPDSASEAT
jgi:hypothetical protein